MGGYAIFTFDKLKNSSEMGSRYKHNFRIYEDIANVDYKKTDENIEYISLNGKTYEEASREEILRMRISGVEQRIRKDAVLGYEIFMGYSHDAENIPVNRWAEKCLNWLERTFNPENREIFVCDKEGNETVVRADNVKSAVLHMDESTPHIHAYVVPIDEHGHLNAKRYTGERDALIRLQTSFAKEMKEFGLKRGMEKSNATASDIARYHSYLKETVSATLPEPMIGESINDYWARANEEYQKEKALHRQDILSLEQKIREVSAERKITVSINTEIKNLITGTRYLNLNMLPFENEVAYYLRKEGKPVLYRVTPVFVGDELVARGVLMEAESIWVLMEIR